MKVSKKQRCAACGKVIRGKKALPVKVWDEEEVQAVVCSVACRSAYKKGVIGGEVEESGLTRTDKIAITVLTTVAVTEVWRAVMSIWWADPLQMVAPLAVHLASAAILAFLAFSLFRGRRSARIASLLVATLTGIGHVSVAFATANPLASFVAISLALPLYLVAFGNPGVTRQALALVAALLLPGALIWLTSVRISDHLDSLERIEQVAMPGNTASSGAGGIRLQLPEGWRALRRDNGIIDWPHSELELIHASTGAAAFVVVNPDCDRRALAEFQERSLDALAQVGGDPVPIGLSRVGPGLTEVRVRLRRGHLNLESFELFRELPQRNGATTEDRPGCLWMHCLSPQRREDRVRAFCREMATAIELETSSPTSD